MRLAATFADRLAALTAPNRAWAARFAGRGGARQPVHVVYGGAHLFAAETPRKLGAVALAALDRHAPDAASLADALGIAPDHADAVYARVRAKLAAEPVEDYRVDFEDGYGTRPDAEEDDAARTVGATLARAARAGLLPPFVGVRVTSLHEETKARSARTLALVLEALLAAGPPPPGFVVTLPKVTLPAHVATFAAMLADVEAAFGIPARTLHLEIMVEHVSAIVAADGTIAVPALVAAADGRCVAAHFGTYDHTASAGVTAAWQRPDHFACDLARGLMQASLAGTPVALSDGATTLLPVEPHKAAPGAILTVEQRLANTAAVRHAWRVHADNVRRSLANGFYQGWDLHPAQLVARYGATYAFFLDTAAPSAARLRNFLDRAARATRVGAEFDDAATGQGLLETFLRGRACGAFTDDDLRAAGLSPDELGERSFATLVARRAAAGASP